MTTAPDTDGPDADAPDPTHAPILKAISLWPPYAMLMALGLKANETRDWSTSHRGWICIHQSKLPSRSVQLRSMGMTLDELVREEPFAHVFRAHALALNAMPLGAIVALGRLKAVRDGVAMESQLAQQAACEPALPKYGGWKRSALERAFGGYGPGRRIWTMDRIWRLDEPVPCGGKQSVWDVPDEVAYRVEAAFRERKVTLAWGEVKAATGGGEVGCEEGNREGAAVAAGVG